VNPTPPRLREVRDGVHVSLVASVTLGGKSLKPLFLSTNVNRPRDLNRRSLLTQFKCFQTPKGYLTKPAWNFYLHEILLPHVLKQREKIGNQPCVVVMDGLNTHRPPYTDELEKVQAIQFFTLPPHSTHLVQPLYLSVFAVLKSAYGTVGDSFKKYEGGLSKKIVKILKAYHQATYPAIIFSA
jgi:hypothetical protein